MFIALRSDAGLINDVLPGSKIFLKYNYRTLEISYNNDAIRVKEHDDILFIRDGELWKIKMFNTSYKHPKLKESSYFNHFYCLPYEQTENYKPDIDSVFNSESGYEPTDEEFARPDFLNSFFFYHVRKILSVQENIISVEENTYGWYGGASTFNSSCLYAYFPDTLKRASLLDQRALDSAGLQLLGENDEVLHENSGIGIIRQHGKWTPRLRFHDWVHSPSFKDYTILNPLNDSLAYNPELPIPWEKLKQQNPEITDAVFTPDKQWMVALTPKELLIHKIRDSLNFKNIKSVPLNKNEAIVGISFK